MLWAFKIFSQVIGQQVLQNPVVPVEKIETYADIAREAFFHYAPKIGIALLVLVCGLWLINMLMRGLNRIMLARDVDATLRPFLKTIISIALKIMLILSVAGMIGLQTTSFVAALGAAGLAIGLALQGSLSNFAGGVLILLFKPFKVNDTIEAQGHIGTVKEIQILYTILYTADNKKVIIPNG
ncbi:MAG: mechanosensitive ion channel family protein, partial [Bacteroidia bacterium]